jgi:hypothetical protein
MSTAQTITRVGLRFRTRRAALLTALGALIAIAATIAILALTGTNHITAASSVANGSSVRAVHYVAFSRHFICLAPGYHCFP